MGGRVARNGAIYLASSLLAKASPFLLLPLLTRELQPAEFGVLAMFLVINTFTGSVVGMSLNANITSNFYSQPRPELALFIGNVLRVLLVSGSISLLLAATIAIATREIFSMPAPALLLMPPLAVASMVGTLYTTVLRNEGRALAYAAFELTQTVLYFTAASALLLGAGFGWLAPVAALLVSRMAMALVALHRLQLHGYLARAYDPQRVRAILRLSLPLVPHALGGMVIAVSDRFFLERMVGLEAVALYSIGYSFGMLLGVLTDSFAKAWLPWVYRVLAAPTEAGKRRIVRSAYAFFAGTFVVAFAGAELARLVLPYLVTAPYVGAGEFILWVMIGYAIRGVYQVFFPFLVHVGATRLLAYSTGAAALVNICLNYLLIDAFGAIGAAYSTAAAFAVSALIVAGYQMRLYPMPWLGRAR